MTLSNLTNASGSALLIATLVAAMGAAAFSPLPSTVAKAPVAATFSVASK
ncbi:hypothetical protein BH09PSE2_BH09PSE2_18780 [soil metagenome]